MTHDEQKVLTVGCQRVWLDPKHRITMVEFAPDAHLDIDLAKRGSQAMREVTGGEARPLLVDFTNLKSQTRECREFYSKDPKHLETYNAVAIIVNSTVSRVIANFFLKINKPDRPTQLFDERARGIEWLKQFS
jgi:hypothetical protein